MNPQKSVTLENVVKQTKQKKGDSMEMILGQRLIREGLITPGQLEEALRNQSIFGYRLGSSLIEMGYLKEEDLMRVLSRKTGVPFIGRKELSSVPKEVIRCFSRSLAIRYHAFPFQLEHNSLKLAMADPNDLEAIQEIAFITGHVVQPYVSTDVIISRAHERYYPAENDGQLNTLIPADPQETGAASAHEGCCPAENDGQPNALIPADSKKTGEASEAPLQMEESQDISPDRIAGDLIAASSRDDVADQIIGYIAREFMTGALFIVRKKVAVGWREAHDGEVADSCTEQSLDLSEPSVLRDVVETKSCCHDTLINTPQNRQILELLTMTSSTPLFAAPISIRNQAVALVLVAAERDDSDPRLTRLLKLVKQAGLAFEMLIIKNKILAA